MRILGWRAFNRAVFGSERETPRRLGWLILFKVAARSFLIQSVWNFERMQNVGWYFAISPVLKRLYGNREERIKAARRHLDFFNTHPFLASYILGYAIKVEEKAARGGHPATEVSSIRMGMMGPLAALGDHFFWASLRPLAALLGVTLVLLAGEGPAASGLGLLVFLAVFNVPHLLVRVLGLMQGYLAGREVVSFLRNLEVQRYIKVLQRLGVVLVGVALAAGPKAAGLNLVYLDAAWASLAALGISLAFFLLLKVKIAAFQIFYLLLVLCLVFLMVMDKFLG
jgi:mannose/fructose/N-acetylgalactosamine-specific phosphotransferase system component IID